MGHFGDYGLLSFHPAKMAMRVISLLNAIQPPNAHRNCYRLVFLSFRDTKFLKITI